MPPFPPPVRAGSAGSPESLSRSPLRFFLTVAALSIPFAWLGAVIDLQLYPGIPVAALAFVCLVSAAALLAYRDGFAAVSALLRRAFDFRRIRAKVWHLPTVLLMPCVTAMSYGLLRAMRSPLPAPRFPAPRGTHSVAWIAWGCLDMVATRVLMVWIYNNLSIKTMFPGGPTRPNGSSR